MAFQRVNTKTMVDTILDHLKKVGTISSLEAEGMYRCRSLTRRICDIRELGYDIVAEWKKDNTGQRYRRYHLIGFNQ